MAYIYQNRSFGYYGSASSGRDIKKQKKQDDPESLKDSPSLFSRILPCLPDRNMQIGTPDHTGAGHLRNASPGKAMKIRIMKKASGYETAVKKRGNDQQDRIQICEKRSMNISFQNTNTDISE